jgi:hypothetical protein
MGGTQRTGLTVPKKVLPRIKSVSADTKPMTLHICWNNGDKSRVDVSGPIETFRIYEPLRRSSDLFRHVRLGEYGADVVWNEEVDMGAETLWRLAEEQSGATMSPDAFNRWRERQAYTLDSAARAGRQPSHGLLLRTGAKPIPRVVALAARALELA